MNLLAKSFLLSYVESKVRTYGGPEGFPRNKGERPFTRSKYEGCALHGLTGFTQAAIADYLKIPRASFRNFKQQPRFTNQMVDFQTEYTLFVVNWLESGIHEGLSEFIEDIEKVKETLPEIQLRTFNTFQNEAKFWSKDLITELTDRLEIEREKVKIRSKHKKSNQVDINVLKALVNQLAVLLDIAKGRKSVNPDYGFNIERIDFVINALKKKDGLSKIEKIGSIEFLLDVKEFLSWLEIDARKMRRRKKK